MTNENPLIRTNWRKLGKLIVGLGKGIAIGIIKILTLLVRGITKLYLAFSNFIKGKYSGFWILLLVFCLIFTLIYLNKPLMEGQRAYQELEQKYEGQLEEYQNLMEQKHELEKKLETNSIKPNLTRVSVKSGVEHWRYLVEKYFPPEQVENALLIMNCESGGNPKAINYGDLERTGYGSYGLFQIHGPTNWEWDNPEVNTDRAVTKFYMGGWESWKNCAIKLGLL